MDDEFDPLTGVYNRPYFELFLTDILEKGRAKRFPVTLLFFEIENFKRCIDKHGQEVGDQVLKQAATLMRQTCREHDLIARIGADRFAVLLWETEAPRISNEDAATMPRRPWQIPMLIFDRFRQSLATQDIPGLGSDRKDMPTISGGLAIFPWDGRDAKELIAAADQALKGAKRGKNEDL